MVNAIGLVETNNVAKGIECCDVMLKRSDVEAIASYPVCPGKYIILIAGEVAAVRSSVDAGKLQALDSLVDDFVIPNIHPQVFPAIQATTEVDDLQALGVIETFSLSSCIVAADFAVKAADVMLIEIRLGRALGGKSFVTMTGDTAAVRSAVQAGVESVREDGLLLDYVVIPSPHPNLLESIV
ncbi:MAG: BMC domain-containing protein [Methanopyri archaeon]|nr:BMC domain-containing protein [Methanopyri archaeon]